jgi:hypothetical protein
MAAVHGGVEDESLRVCPARELLLTSGNGPELTELDASEFHELMSCSGRVSIDICFFWGVPKLVGKADLTVA